MTGQVDHWRKDSWSEGRPLQANPLATGELSKTAADPAKTGEHAELLFGDRPELQFDRAFGPDGDFDADRDFGLDRARFGIKLPSMPGLGGLSGLPTLPSVSGLGYRVGMVGAAGVLIWGIVMAISPTTLTDTAALPEAGSTAAENLTPEDFEIAGPESVVGLASDDEGLAVGADGMPQAATPLEAQVGDVPAGDAPAGDAQTVVADAPAAANDADGSAAPGTTALGAGAAVDSSSPSTVAPAPSSSTSAPAPVAAAPTTAPPAAAASLDYQSNLAMLQRASVRNTNHDNSPYLNTPSDQLVLTNHYGPRSEYLNNPGQNPEQAFPVPNGGQFRAACEFSHFAYDLSLIHI